MILPTTYASAIVLLIVSLICLGSWINTFKLTGNSWRPELFYIDFSIGTLLCAVIAAFTLGSLGSDLAFTDRMLVSGRSAQAIVFGSAFIFNLGNMLLLASVPLIGMAAAFLFSFGLAVIVTALFYVHGANPGWLGVGLGLMVFALVVDAVSGRIKGHRSSSSAAAKPATTTGKAAASAATAHTATATAPTTTASKRIARPAPAVRKMNKTKKGFVVAAVGGILLGLFYPVAAKGMTGDLGLGPYAGLLIFCAGILVSTFMFSFYFLNISISGGPLRLNAYFRGRASQHFLGFAGGAIWTAGSLAALCAMSVPAHTGPNAALDVILPVASVVLVVIWGTTVWREFAGAPGASKMSIAISVCVFMAGLVLVALGATAKS